MTLKNPNRAILLILAAVQFTSIVDFMIVMPLSAQLMRTLAIGPRQYGWIVSSYTISAFLSGLFASSLMDRFGRKAAFLTLYCGFLLGTLFCGLAGSYVALLAARVFTGAFGGILGGIALAIVSDVFPPKQRGSATGALMSAFAFASVAGVPFGLYLGNRYDWHAPFLMLVALGSFVLPAAMIVLPPLRDHLNPSRPAAHPLARTWATLTHPNHLRAFALVVTLMVGGFAVIPYISPYVVFNVGVAEEDLPWIYVAGGAFTLVAAPAIGKLADRFGKLRMYWIVAPVSAVFMLAVTNLPKVPMVVAVLAVGLLMVGNAGRMVVAMAMVTESVEADRRGSFLSANSAVQHLATSLGALVGSYIVVRGPDGTLRHFDRVGYVAIAATLASLFLAARLRAAEPARKTTPEISLGAAAEAMGDASEPLQAAESF